jgi:hypothetical protein
LICKITRIKEGLIEDLSKLNGKVFTPRFTGSHSWVPIVDREMSSERELREASELALFLSIGLDETVAK